MARVRDLSVDERHAVLDGEVVVGVDEVGRGSLAGPVVVGAVVLREGTPPPDGLADSKVLSRAQREALVDPITRWAADWSLGWSGADEIDAWGLRVALAVAATRALDALRVRPGVALVDGSVNLLSAPGALDVVAPGPPVLSYADLSHRAVVRGDATCASIAAASVLAKVHRDRAMDDLARAHPAYGWTSNKGYGAPAHLAALRALGPTVLHRRSWALPEWPSLDADRGSARPGGHEAAE
ncbi:MAG: ribonuclease HII [Acidimicrobiales bacterium]